MKRLIYTMLFLLCSMAGMSQTNEKLPEDAQPLTSQLYLSPSDSTVWAANEFSGLAIKVGTWHGIDSLFSLLPTFDPGTEGQIYRILNGGTNDVQPEDPIRVGYYVHTQEQLDSLTGPQGVFIPFDEIFNSWKRFSHGTGTTSSTASANTPSNLGNTLGWTYDDETNKISSTVNSGSHTGFVSPTKLSAYDFTVNLTSDGGDNDAISFIIAYMEDDTDMVTNAAYGQSSETYPFLNTTDPTIPNQHTLTLVRTRGGFTTTGENMRYGVVYDWGRPGQKIVAQSTDPWQTTSNWGGADVDVRVVRLGDLIRVYTTDFSDAPAGKGELRFMLEIDLDDDSDLHKFKGAQSYGYGAWSNPNSTFAGGGIDFSENEVYDLRNGEIWVADDEGNWSVAGDRILWDEILAKTIVYNPVFKQLIYVEKPDYKILADLGDVYTKVEVDSLAAPQTLSLGGDFGQISISLGDTVALTSLARESVTSSFASWFASLGTKRGLITFVNTTGSTGFPTVTGQGILSKRSLETNNSMGSFALWSSNDITNPNLYYNVGINETTWTGWQSIPSKQYVDTNFVNRPYVDARNTLARGTTFDGSFDTLYNRAGLSVFGYSDIAAGFPGGSGGGVIFNRNSGSSNAASFALAVEGVTDKLYLNVKNGPTTWTGFSPIATLDGSKEWSGNQIWIPSSTVTNQPNTIRLSLNPVFGPVLNGSDGTSTAFTLRSYSDTGVQLTLQRGGINANGAYTNTSDSTIKNIVTDFDYSAVDSLQATSFTYKDNRDSGRVHVGYIAQEVRQVLPDAVYESTETGLLSVDHVQVLIAKLAMLEEKVKQLEARIEQLEN